MGMVPMLVGLLPQEAEIRLWDVACVLVVGVVSFFQFLCWPCANGAWPWMRCSPRDAMRMQSDQPLLPDSHNVGLFSSDGSLVNHVCLCQLFVWRPSQRSIMHQFQNRLGSWGAWICIHPQIPVQVRSFSGAYGSERFRLLLGLGLAGCCCNQMSASWSVALCRPNGYLCWIWFVQLNAFGSVLDLVSSLLECDLGLMECLIWCHRSGPPIGPWVVHPSWTKLIFLVTTSV